MSITEAVFAAILAAGIMQIVITWFTRESTTRYMPTRQTHIYNK